MRVVFVRYQIIGTLSIYLIATVTPGKIRHFRVKSPRKSKIVVANGNNFSTPCTLVIKNKKGLYFFLSHSPSVMGSCSLGDFFFFASFCLLLSVPQVLLLVLSFIGRLSCSNIASPLAARISECSRRVDQFYPLSRHPWGLCILHSFIEPPAQSQTVRPSTRGLSGRLPVHCTKNKVLPGSFFAIVSPFSPAGQCELANHSLVIINFVRNFLIQTF